MAQLLLEFFCEEIPARMQARAESDLERLLSERLKAAGLSWESLVTFSGPRRLGLVIEGLPEKTEDVREERKGPKVGAPDQAVQGFLRSAGLDSLDQCKIEEGKKGAFYVALIEKPGRETAEVIAEALPEIARNFPWPKSMKFGQGDTAQRWVRPLQRVLCLLGGKVVDADVFGIKAGDLTEGHRIHGSGEAVAVTDFTDYEAKLRANGVTLTRDERRDTILTGAREVCEEAGLKLVEDAGLLEEVTGLVEHPVAILGDMAPDFLDLPPEVIQLTMKTHQKYFAVEDKAGRIAPKFVVIANQAAPDGGKAIAAGNARVLSARLSDARHFWDLDRAKGLEAMAGELNKVTFHEKLGTVADKAERVAALAKELAPAVGADPQLAFIAAKLAKADLVSQMVYEFPELQGVMGRYYAHEFPAKPQAQSRDLPASSQQGPGSAPEPSSGLSGNSGLLAGLSPADRAAVADAIRDHYKPQGPSDAVPTAPVSAAVALADKLDTLVGFWAIDEKPTGSKDPFALRRAALGVIRISQTSEAKLPVKKAILSWVEETCHVAGTHERSATGWWQGVQVGLNGEAYDTVIASAERETAEQPEPHATVGWHFEVLERVSDKLAKSLLAFFADRLKVHLKDEGVRHDVIDAVFALGDDDLVRVTKKSRALQSFLETADGAALLAGYRRAANILAAEEKKGFDLDGALGEALGEHPTPALPSRGGRDAAASGAETADGARPAQAREESSGGSAASPSPSGEGRGGGLTDDEKSALMIEIAKTAGHEAERALIAAIEGAGAVAAKALDDEDFESAMAALAKLREPVDAFFEAVVVNDERDIVRRNRLLLLSRIRAAADQVADFSRLEGEAR
ncbi:MAG: glycine--tRNA ligase subunit beta [Alphaproteobacteria bacterium]|nr:glycine--tRNA ligase subunit beta [Alphaproteobacteria bacterium]